MSPHSPSSPLGRPRDKAVGPALLAAARRLVLRHGYQAVTIKMIIEDAGVGRQTLYRRWASKADLVLDAFYESAGHIEIPDQGPLQETLTAFFVTVFARLNEDRPAIRNLIASAQDDPVFLQTFRDRFVTPRAAIVEKILHQAIQRGDLPATADVDMAVITLHGAFWYQLLLDQPLDSAFADRLCQLVLAGLKHSTP